MQATCLTPLAPAVTLYEQDELCEVTGGTLRPGGLTLTSELLHFCNLKPGSAMLDIGCGPGHTLNLMASRFGLLPTGLDPSETMLEKAARQAPAAELIQGSATAIPCENQRFDGIVCECVLSLTGDITASLQEMHRVLRPGGVLILTDIYCKRPELQPDLPDLQSCASRALPLDAVTDGLEQAGFTLVSLRERSDLLKQLAGQIIFSHGSLEKFWQLFMGEDEARRTCCALAAAPLGYYALVAKKGVRHG
jgi:SAM-dependent methyltransferase